MVMLTMSLLPQSEQNGVADLPSELLWKANILSSMPAMSTKGNTQYITLGERKKASSLGQFYDSVQASDVPEAPQSRDMMK